MKRSRQAGMILLALAVVGGSFWLGRITYSSPNDGARLTELRQENLGLKAALERRPTGEAAERDAPSSAPVARVNGPSTTPLNRDRPSAGSPEALRVLQESLASTHQSMAAAQARVEELTARLEQARSDNARLAAMESGLNEQVASWKRSTESKEVELSRRHDELALLEASNKKLREETSGAAQKTSQQLQSLNELQEIYRRREAYLNTLMGRYREVTEQYRAFASVLENRRGPEGTSGAGISIAGPELNRIQNSIAMAEDDLRQLNSLNAQVLRIQKKLAGK